MGFAVIIPTFNEQQSIAAAIKSAAESGAEKVVVADGGSTDKTEEISKKFPVCQFLKCPKSGRGHQQSFAVKNTDAEVFVFLHGDSVLDPQSLQAITLAIQKNPASVCWGGFYQRIEDEGFAFRILEFGNWLRSMLFGLVYGDQGIWVTKEAIELIGGFPEIPIMEDVVLSQKLREHSRPKMLRPKLMTSARRWKKDGILKRTISNWKLLWRFKRGATPEEILQSYRPNKNES